MLAPGLLAGLVLPPLVASSDVVVRWRGAASCQQGPRARATVDALLGEGSGHRAIAHVDVREEGAQWRARIELHRQGEPVHRELRGAPCPALADAIALVIAVGIDPMSVSASMAGDSPTPASMDPPGPGVPEVHLGPAPAGRDDPGSHDPGRNDPGRDDPGRDDPGRDDPGRDDPGSNDPGRDDLERDNPGSNDQPGALAPPSPPARRGPWAVLGVVDGGGALGLLPGVGGQLGAGLEVARGRARLGVTGRYGFARTVLHPEGIDAGADISAASGRLHGCWAPGTARFTLGLCGGLEAGVYRADGLGLEQTTRVRSAWAALVPHARLSIRALSWLSVGPSIELPVSLVRPRFSIDDFSADLVRVGAVGLRVALMVEFVFFDERRSGRARGSR